MTTEKITLSRGRFKAICTRALLASLKASIDADIELTEISLVHGITAEVLSAIEKELFPEEEKETDPKGFEKVRKFHSQDHSRTVQILAPEGVTIPDEIMKKVEKIAKELCEDNNDTNRS